MRRVQIVLLCAMAGIIVSCQKQNLNPDTVNNRAENNSKKISLITPKTHSSNASKETISPNLPIPTCSPENTVLIDWYLQTFDENGIVIHESYMFSTSYCTEAGGGNSGSNYQTPEELASAILDIMENNTVAINRFVSAWAVEELPETRTAMYKWDCIQSKGWWVSSIEKGVHKKTGSGLNAKWEWQSLEHINLVKEGLTVGGVVTHSLLYSNPIIGKYNATMDLGIGLTAEAKVVGIVPVTRYFFRTAKHTFNVNGSPFLLPGY